MKLSGLVLTLALASVTSAAERPPPDMSNLLPEVASTPLIEDFYPPTSRVLGEQGRVKLRLCYDEQGRVTDSTMEQSSTFKRIDDAAVKMGKRYRINPDVVDGQPQSGCTVVSVEFSLNEPASPADRVDQGGSRPTLPPGPLPPLPLPPPPPPVRSGPLPEKPPPARFIPLINRISRHGYVVSDGPAVACWTYEQVSFSILAESMNATSIEGLPGLPV